MPLPDDDGYLKLWGNPGPWIENNPPATLLSVKHLRLDFLGVNNEIGSAESLKFLPDSMANLHNLQSLCFSYCGELPANLGVLNITLTHLTLSYCNIKSLPESVATHLSNLTSLHLRACDSLTELPPSLGRLGSLKDLSLKYCDRIQSLPNTMAHLLNFDTFSIEGCYSLTQLPPNLNVTFLELIHCKINFIPRGLISLRHLIINLHLCSHVSFANLKDSLYLHHLTIHMDDEPQVPKLTAISNHIPNLQILSFFDITYIEFFVKIPVILDGLDKLIILDIELTGIKYLPWSITELNKLRFLMLPWEFNLDSLPYHLNDCVLISVTQRHVRKAWKQLRQELNLPLVVAADGYPSFISPPGYLLLQETPGQWISHNYHSRLLVNMLELPGFNDDNVLGQFSNLTHLYVYCRQNEYWLSDTITGLRHLSLHSKDWYPKFQSNNLAKLTNLETLDLNLTNFLEDADLPVSLRRLSLYNSNIHSLPSSMEKLSSLTLELFQCEYLDSLPQNLNIIRLKLDWIINSLPANLRHLEIFHVDEDSCNCTNYSDCGGLEQCLTQLVNLETLSITCYYIDSLPSIARQHKLQVLQLKDCFSLRQLPSDLDDLIELDTLDISGTRVKSLPHSIMKLPKLRRVILPRCFTQEILLKNSQVFIIDNTDDIYYKHKKYYDSCYGPSPNTFGEGNDAALGSVFEEKVEIVQEESEQGVACGLASEHCAITQIPAGLQLNGTTDGQTNTVTLENGQNKNPQSDMEKSQSQKINITRETIQQLLCEKMRLVDAAKQLGVSRSTLKRRLKYFKIKWPSSKKRKQKLCAKKRKLTSETHSTSNSETNATINDNMRQYTVEVNQLTLSNHLLCERNSVDNLTLEPSFGNAKEIVMDPQCDKDGHQPIDQKLDGPNECILSNIVHRDESSNTFNVKATYYDDTVKFKFCLKNNMEQLKHEVGKRLELEVGTFRMKYQDEDEHWIRISCTSELEEPLRLARSSGLNYVKLSIIDERFLNGAHKRRRSSEENSEHPNIAQQEESSNTLPVKATYCDDIVRFDFSLTYNIEQLKQELGRRLELEVSTFRIKYQDEDKEWIRMSCTSDLKYALRLSRSSGLNCLRLSVSDEWFLNGVQKKSQVLEKNHEQSTVKSEGGKFTQHSKSDIFYWFPFSEEVVSCILPYIKGHTDVKSDGNCGFRAIALFVYDNEEKWVDVRRELMVELTTHQELYKRALGGDDKVFKEVCHIVEWYDSLVAAPIEHWYEASNLGIVVATTYQKIFTYWSKQCPTTFLPLEPRLGNQPPMEYINITRINNNHFIALHMSTTDIPLPPPTPLWMSNCELRVKNLFLYHFKKQLDCYANYVTITRNTILL